MVAANRFSPQRSLKRKVYIALLARFAFAWWVVFNAPWFIPRAAITVTQIAGEVSVTGTTTTITLNGVAAGALLVIVATNESNTTVFATPTDGTNTWAKDVELTNASDGVAMIASAQNVAGGNTTVTVKPSSGSATYRCRMIEVAGCVTTGVDVTSSKTEGSTVTSHVCAADASHINPTRGCIVFCSSETNATTGGTTQGSGYTQMTTAGNFTNWQYQIFSSAPVNQQGDWTSVNARLAVNVMAAYVAPAAAAGRLARTSDLSGIGGAGQQCFNPTLSL